MLFLSSLVSLGLPILFISELVTAQERRCGRNEEWSYPVDGCNTCVPVLWCEVRQEYGCNCRSGYTRGVLFGICIERIFCPLAPPPTTTSSTSTMGPTSTTMESTTSTMGPTTTTMESTTSTMGPTTTTMESTTTSIEPTTSTMQSTSTTMEYTTTTTDSDTTTTT